MLQQLQTRQRAPVPLNKRLQGTGDFLDILYMKIVCRFCEELDHKTGDVQLTDGHSLPSVLDCYRTNNFFNFINSQKSICASSYFAQ
jgi:hypothetical protein